MSISVQPDLDPVGRRIRTLPLWVAVVMPRPTGMLRLKARDPHVTSRIDYNLLAESTDLRRPRTGVRLARRVIKQEPLVRLVAEEIAPGPPAGSDEALDAAIRAALIIFYW